MGFGLWPACDSAGTSGVFWATGPCFGIGSYSELIPGPTSEFLLGTTPPPSYIVPLAFLAESERAPGPVATNPRPPSPAPSMVLYLTDGRTIAVADWWVEHGRLQYVTESGIKDSIDLSKLDLEQTIKQNQTRGLEFRLKFTRPSDRWPPSVRP